MISAKEAKNKTVGAAKALEDNQLRVVEALIEQAINIGRYAIQFNENLYEPTRKELEKNGYVVKRIFDTRYRDAFQIAWSDSEDDIQVSVTESQPDTFDSAFARFEQVAKRAGVVDE